MPNLTWNVTGTDGLFKTGVPDLFVFDPEGRDPQPGHVNEYLVPNLNTITKYPVVSSSPDGVFNPYVKPETTGDWAVSSSMEVNSLHEFWAVIVPDQTDKLRLYLCRDLSEKLTIPNYDDTASVEFKIVSDINTSNFNATSSPWKTWTISGTQYLVFAPVKINNSGSQMHFLIASYNANTNKIHVSLQALNKQQATSDADDTRPLPTVSLNTKTGNQITLTLEERVIALEMDMVTVKQDITKIKQDIEDIKTKIVDAGLTGFLHYVSR